MTSDHPENASGWARRERGAVAVLTFSGGVMGFDEAAQLQHHVEALADDADVRVIVITGAPGRFIDHADLRQLLALAEGRSLEADPRSWFRAIRAIEAAPQPVVAAVDGPAGGGGFELALACTMRLASPRATFALPETRAGIIPGAGGTQRLTRLVGSGRAAELILRARTLSARDAHALGVVEDVLGHEGFAERVAEWVAPIAALPGPTVAAVKRAVVEGSRLPLVDGLRLEGELYQVLQSEPAVIERLRLATRHQRDGERWF